MAHKTTQHTVDLHGTGKKLSFEVELVPSEHASALLAGNTNVAKVNVGGKEFFAVVGKTTLEA